MTKLNFRDWLKDQANKRHGDRAKLQEWLSALRMLYEQMQDWLKQDDAEGVIRTDIQSETIREGDLGVYDAPALHLWLNLVRVVAQPIARNVIGPSRGAGVEPLRAQGRVDLTNGVDVFHLYRTADEGHGDRWVIVDPNLLTLRELDKESFENALQSLFS